MEPRLAKRYKQVVRSHLQIGHELSAGIKSRLGKDVAFAQTQAAWRFLNNERCKLEELSKPLLAAGHELSETECDQYLLVAHDWSHLFYGGHQSKQDTYQTCNKSVGYELHSSLLMSDRHGGPLSQVAMNLKTKKETLSSYGKNLEGLTHLEELAKRVEWIESQGFSHPLVHIVDREGDSVAFFRGLGTRYWLIRVNDTNYAQDGVSNRKMKEIAQGLAFTQARAVQYKGKPAHQQIAEKEVTITRSAHPRRNGINGKRLPAIKGEPIKVRLLVSRIVDKAG